jgi:hypothetical protein
MLDPASGSVVPVEQAQLGVRRGATAHRHGAVHRAARH